jgi:hypothetical protein
VTYTCGACKRQHADPYQARICYGLASPYPAPMAAPHYDGRDEPGSMSPRQERVLVEQYAATRDMTHPHGRRLSVNAASKLITELKEKAVSGELKLPEEDPRLTMLKGMFDMIPNGYFAVEMGDGSPLKFFRISKRKVGHLKGCRVIQTQHGEAYTTRIVVTEAGRWSIRDDMILDHLMLVVVDYQHAAMRYAKEIGKCARCNAELTDERSRWYGIGPECEKHWPWYIEAVDLEHNGVPYRAG